MALTPPAGIEESDFESIEDAVLETARGRWFLREFARRARAADNARLMDALERIERAVTGRQHEQPPAVFDYEAHAGALEERQARLSEIAWMLRERGYDGDICAVIEREARALARLARTIRGGGPMHDAPVVEAPPPASPSARRIEPTLALAAPAQLEEPPADLPAPPEPANVAPSVDWREKARAALAPIDRLPARERLAFFA